MHPLHPLLHTYITQIKLEFLFIYSLAIHELYKIKHPIDTFRISPPLASCPLIVGLNRNFKMLHLWLIKRVSKVVLISSNAGEGLARLKRFFPTVDNETITSVMRAKKNEEKSVKQLLALGFPLKKQP